jgi:hypothetical protein
MRLIQISSNQNVKLTMRMRNMPDINLNPEQFKSCLSAALILTAKAGGHKGGVPLFLEYTLPPDEFIRLTGNPRSASYGVSRSKQSCSMPIGMR